MSASASGSFAPPSRVAGHGASAKDFRQRCRTLLHKLPPMEGSVKYKRSWSIEEALEQHQSLMRQHELQTSIGHNHVAVRRAQVDFSRSEAAAAAQAVKEALASGRSSNPEVTKQAQEAARNLKMALQLYEAEERNASAKTLRMEDEIEKSNQEMVLLREAIDDVARGGGPIVVGMPGNPSMPTKETEDQTHRQVFYCSDCHVGGHGQRFCLYLLKRPNWRVYPSEKWFEDKSGQVSHCPLGRRGVDFTDETYFSRMAMHIKGRIWLEDKRKLYEFVPDLMPLTYIIVDQKWVGEPPPPEESFNEPMPWFVKETDRNWGTSVVCCQRSDECMALTKPEAAYVVQRHIEKPLLYDNGEKMHIKFYNLLYGKEDGQTWNLYCYKDGYLCVSPHAWSPTDLSKEGQVTIIRTKRIGNWPHWEKVYPMCKASMAEVITRAVQQGKLLGRTKKQFEIISADFVVTTDFKVYLLEFNTGPVLKDPEDSPDANDAGMILGALSIVEPWEQGDIDQWDFACEAIGAPLSEEDQTSAIDAL